MKKIEKNAGVKEESTTGKTIIRLQKIDSNDLVKDRVFCGSTEK